MPRNILVKRRTMQDSTETAMTEDDRCSASGTAGSEHFYRHRQDSEEDPGFSECSSDSGRESALAGDKSSPSLSSQRPQLLLYRSSTVSSSSSSENLQNGPDSRVAQSPLSPYPLGHITLLPRILENLAVSGSNQAEIKVSQENGTDHQPSATGTFTQQLPAPLPLNNALSIHSPCGHHRLNDTPATSTSAAQLAELPFSWLSPASRKRSNSMGNSTDPAAAANANPQHTLQTSKPKQRKIKNGRRVGVDDVTTSPVSGTVITMVDNDTRMPKDVIIVRRGDLDKTTNIVEVTEEAKLELAKIENKIGEYTCKLCRLQYSDAFQLAAHNCSRIVHIEYQCPECGKTFHCPANLASHRRWHKPKTQSAPSTPKIQKVLTIPKFRETSAPPKATTVPLNDCKLLIDKSTLPAPAIPPAQMPFKKRFFFGKGNLSKAATASGQQKAETMKFPSSFPRETPLGKPLLDPQMENFRCQVCHGIVHGAEHFARHWQECLVAASKTWASFLFPSKHP